MRYFILFTLFFFSLFGDMQNEIEILSKKYLGNDYKWGGTTPDGFDCSGYTKYIFEKKGIILPRTAMEQSQVGSLVLDEFKKGDLLFFNTDTKRGIPVTHVGVYLENNKFIHAAGEKKGVIISSFSKYENTFVTAKRILDSNDTSIEKDFFVINYQKALKSTTKINCQINSYELINGKYLKKG